MLQRSPECPYAVKDCAAQPCTHPTGGAGFCRWSGTIAKGCVCIKIENNLLAEWVERVLLAALIFMGVVIALDALIALVACLLSGLCELAIAVALVGAAAAVLIIMMIKSAPDPIRSGPGPVNLASASPGDSGTARDLGAAGTGPSDTGAVAGPPATG